MGPSELVIIAVLFLLIFGPDKIGPMAREVGKFVGQARGAIDEFKAEITDDSKDRKTRNATNDRSRSSSEVSRSSQNGSRNEKPRENSKGDDAPEDEEYDL